MELNSEQCLQESAAAKAGRILHRLFSGGPKNIAVRLWNSETLCFGESRPECTLVFNRPKPFRDMILHSDPLRLAEAYFRGAIDIEGDFYPALLLKDMLQTRRLSVAEKASLLKAALEIEDPSPVETDTGSVNRWMQPLHQLFLRRADQNLSRKAIGFHYDVSNEFYRLWLDEQMIYSCAYFERHDESLEQAQCNKLDHICRKLRLKPGERLLDIGCGWGALVIWAAKNYGVEAHGITLSRNQYEYALQRIREQGLEQQVRVELKDYRDLQGEAVYDKIASVGMFEHVGLGNLPRYFGTVNRLLRAGGLFLNHGITHDAEGWSPTVETKLINQYVFPDGELDTVSNVGRRMEQSQFEILDVEALRPHYALTLRHWVKRLEQQHSDAIRHVSEATYRIWRLYMAGSALAFEAGETEVYQILGAKRIKGPIDIPLTRRDLYRQPARFSGSYGVAHR